MLQIKIDKLDDVPEPFREHYFADPAGGFHLDIEADDDLGPLRRAARRNRQDREGQERIAARRAEEIAARQAEAEAQRAQREAAAQAQVEQRKAAFAAKAEPEKAALESTLRAQVASLTKDAHRLLIEHEARGIARKIAARGADAVLIPHIVARLAVETRDNTRRVVVTDGEGKPCALTLDGLTEQFTTDATFAPLLRDFAGERAEHARKVAETLGAKPK